MAGPGGNVNLKNVLNATTNLSPVPMWVRVGSALSYLLFQTAATTVSINLFTLPIGAIIHATKIKHSVAFAGASITAVTMSVGISGSLAKYGTAFDVLQAVSGTAFGYTPYTAGGESDSATKQITATATSTGANLSALTSGAVDIWCLLSAPN